MIDDVRVTFAALSRGPPTPRSSRVLALPERSGVWVGVDEEQHPHLLLEAPDTRIAAIKVDALDVASREFVISGQLHRVCDISCRLHLLNDVFDHFIVAVLDRADRSGVAPSDAVGIVLDEWSVFLSVSDRPAGRREHAALLAEAARARRHCRPRPEWALPAWTGRARARHDFRRGWTALEVKATLAHTGNDVTIHGVDQMAQPDQGSLYLHFVRLEYAVDGGSSVRREVDHLLAAGIPAESLYRAISDSGVKLGDFLEEEHGFAVRERHTIPVNETTPRIVAASFENASVPAGVIDISYRIDLTTALSRAIDAASYGRVIARLATSDDQ